MKTSEAINELATALNKAQSGMTGAKKGATNPFFKKSYSDFSMVIEAISQPFADNGLCFVQAAEMNEMKAAVTTRIMHVSGQYIESVTELPPTKNDAQGVGSAISYAKRYGLQALAGVPSVDDDGQDAVKHQTTAKKTTKASLTEVETKAIDALHRHAENKDGQGMAEVWNELTEAETQHVWAKLPQDTQTFLTETMNNA